MFVCLSFCISIFRPGMVLNQGQLSFVVSDWESYLSSLFCHLRLWVVNFCLVCLAPDGAVSVVLLLLVV